MEAKPPYANADGPFNQKTVRERIRALFLENLGYIVTRVQIQEVAGSGVENWHQRLSELRTDQGYEILTNRDRADLRPGEYLMLTDTQRAASRKRVMPTPATWKRVLDRAHNRCVWAEDGTPCGLREGEIDPVGGGRVHLTPDHMTPHSIDPASDPSNSDHWQPLCGRHQVMKKNFWDSSTGKFNYVAIIQAAPQHVKRQIFESLKEYFGD